MYPCRLCCLASSEERPLHQHESIYLHYMLHTIHYTTHTQRNNASASIVFKSRPHKRRRRADGRALCVTYDDYRVAAVCRLISVLLLLLLLPTTPSVNITVSHPQRSTLCVCVMHIWMYICFVHAAWAHCVACFGCAA